MVWLGVQLLRSKARFDFGQAQDPAHHAPATRLWSFLSGLFLTLGDLKAIVFYASAFPTLLDLPQLTNRDTVLVLVLTVLVVGGVKVAYACAAQWLVRKWGGVRVAKVLPKAAGVAMVGSGAYVIAKT
jgi:threonine/homoserine/homoserine lactone efflux protein